MSMVNGGESQVSILPGLDTKRKAWSVSANLAPASTPLRISEEELQRLELDLSTVFGSAMKRVLVVNDSYGTKTMREAVLDEFNRINRYFEGRMKALRETCQDTTISENGSNGVPPV